MRHMTAWYRSLERIRLTPYAKKDGVHPTCRIVGITVHLWRNALFLP